MRYFLGVDTGATKSHALIADENGRAVGFGESGPGNYEAVGWDGMHQALHTITDQALASAGIAREQIAGAGFGIAGYDWPAERKPTEQVIDSLGLSVPYGLVNDTIVGLLAGATEGWGVVVVAGTSNNCRGRDRHGREGWVTGCGPRFAEYGGAGELVRKAIQVVSLAWSKRGPATRLTEAFLELTGATDATDLLEGLALERYHLWAAAAPLVFQVAAEGDAVAQETIHWAGRELGSLANGVIRQLGFEGLEFEVVLAGSLYNGGPMLIDALRETVHEVAPGARLVRLTAPPVIGGVLLGMEQKGLEYTGVRETLIRTTNVMLNAV
jgi:N-acetylglucosamine kinase-like BadF-type ATPase